MARYSKGLPSVLVVLGLFLILGSCGPTDVNSLRQNYTAELNGWFKAETPTAMDAAAMAGEEDAAMADEAAGDEEGADADGGEDRGEDSGEDGAEDGGEDGGMPDMPPMDVQQTVTLDILVKHEGGGKLPGITLDISQADSTGAEKQSWKLWVDTSDLGVVKQITETLEDVTLDEGDGFNVEVRSFVPPEEQSEYKEFSSSPAA